MGDGMIYLLAMLIEYDIRKVVVLVDDEIERIVVCLGSLEEKLQLVGMFCLGQNEGNLFLCVIFGICADETIESDAEVRIESFLQNIYLSCDL